MPCADASRRRESRSNRQTAVSDCATLLALSTRHEPGSLVAIAMGDHGLPTRLLAPRFAAPWTYAGMLRDVGQVRICARCCSEFRFHDLDERTAIYGIVGGSVSHSVSPSMHNAAFASPRLNAVYLPLPAVDADDFMSFARVFGIAGASVTIPFKVPLFDRLDEVYSAARRIGAINTIRVADGRWLGDNTDTNGFLRPLQDRVPISGLRASVLGAGGAARAVADALASCDCAVRVHARDAARGRQVAELTRASVGPWPPEPGSWDLLINCTPIGHVAASSRHADPAGNS